MFPVLYTNLYKYQGRKTLQIHTHTHTQNALIILHVVWKLPYPRRASLFSFRKVSCFPFSTTRDAGDA